MQVHRSNVLLDWQTADGWRVCALALTWIVCILHLYAQHVRNAADAVEGSLKWFYYCLLLLSIKNNTEHRIIHLVFEIHRIEGNRMNIHIFRDLLCVHCAIVHWMILLTNCGMQFVDVGMSGIFHGHRIFLTYIFEVCVTQPANTAHVITYKVHPKNYHVNNAANGLPKRLKSSFPSYIGMDIFTMRMTWPLMHLLLTALYSFTIWKSSSSS